LRKIGRRTLFGNSRAVSSLLTAVILCGSVLVIGGAVWAFANNSSSLMGTDYFDEVNENVDKARERFMVENIEPMNASCLRVWVYNYGDIGVNVTTCVFRNGSNIGQLTGQFLNGGEMNELDIPVQTLVKGDELVVKVISVRGTTENESYVLR
jgi:archaellum component FlaF (FlaF/FlaG flagellin family)